MGRRAGIERELASRVDQRVLKRFVHGKNGWVPCGHKGVDGGIKWRASTRETEVKLDGWCEGGLEQQRNDGGGCAIIHERVENPGSYCM